MGLNTTESVRVAAAPSRVFPLVAPLDVYPQWLGLVHTAIPEPEAVPPAWSVEIRAQVGPFARSKQLRMVRSRFELDRLIEFERAELDGRRHARWALRVELEPQADETTLVTMHLAYDGSLWTGGVLDRVLADEVAKGRDGLAALVNAAPMR